MSFLLFLLIVAVILQLASYFAFSSELMPLMWVVIGVAAVLTFSFYKDDAILFLQYDLIKFAIIYFIAGIVYATSAAVTKAFYLSNKMKREWAKFRIDPKNNDLSNDKLKFSFVEKFSKENRLDGYDIFKLETVPTHYWDTDPKPVIVKSGVDKFNFLPRIANWAAFWPFFLFSFITYDALKWMYQGFANAFRNSYDNLIKRLFNNTIQ